jgi:hypothetical protein
MSLRPQLQVIADQLQVVAKAARTELPTFTEEQLRWSPSADRWSILLIADHLVRSHTATDPKLAQAIADAPPCENERCETIPYSFVDKIFVAAVSPGAKVKLPVPPIFEPAIPEATGSAVIRELLRRLDEFSGLFEKADEKKLRGIRVASPLNKMFRPSLMGYLDAMVQHDRYHWGQVEALRQEPNFPKV